MEPQALGAQGRLAFTLLSGSAVFIANALTTFLGRPPSPSEVVEAQGAFRTTMGELMSAGQQALPDSMYMSGLIGTAAIVGPAAMAGVGGTNALAVGAGAVAGAAGIGLGLAQTVFTALFAKGPPAMAAAKTIVMLGGGATVKAVTSMGKIAAVLATEKVMRDGLPKTIQDIGTATASIPGVAAAAKDFVNQASDTMGGPQVFESTSWYDRLPSLVSLGNMGLGHVIGNPTAVLGGTAALYSMYNIWSNRREAAKAKQIASGGLPGVVPSQSSPYSRPPTRPKLRDRYGIGEVGDFAKGTLLEALYT